MFLFKFLFPYEMYPLEYRGVNTTRQLHLEVQVMADTFCPTQLAPRSVYMLMVGCFLTVLGVCGARVTYGFESAHRRDDDHLGRRYHRVTNTNTPNETFTYLSPNKYPRVSLPVQRELQGNASRQTAGICLQDWSRHNVVLRASAAGKYA